jgi:hypothetical protein
MSFSGRRVSILRPADARRLSTVKDLSVNGMSAPLSIVIVSSQYRRIAVSIPL